MLSQIGMLRLYCFANNKNIENILELYVHVLFDSRTVKGRIRRELNFNSTIQCVHIISTSLYQLHFAGGTWSGMPAYTSQRYHGQHKDMFIGIVAMTKRIENRIRNLISHHDHFPIPQFNESYRNVMYNIT